VREGATDDDLSARTVEEKKGSDDTRTHLMGDGNGWLTTHTSNGRRERLAHHAHVSWKTRTAESPRTRVVGDADPTTHLAHYGNLTTSGMVVI